jgi:hypothetical protein
LTAVENGGAGRSKMVALGGVDVLCESREAVIRDGIAPDDHVINAMDFEQP